MPLTLCLLLSLALFLSACGPKPVPPESPLDTAESHYQRGLTQLEAGELMDAQREFERARMLDPDFPGHLVGTALVAMEQRDFWRARQEVGKALHQDSRFTDAYLALGRIVTAEGVARAYPVESWSKEALAAYRRAAERDPGNPAVAFYQGQCYFEAGQLESARSAFTQVMTGGRGPYLARAQEELENVQLIERVAPGSAWGMKIARLPHISRAELSVLLLEELRVDALIKQRRLPHSLPRFSGPDPPGPAPLPEVKDIAGSWARPWIEEILRLGIPGLELFPDHNFQPGAAVDRAGMAVVTHGILVLLSGDQELATRYLGETSRFPDVRSDSYAYNAIALNAERGIITADHLTGLFHPEGLVSGAEAMQIIRQLQNAVRFEF